MAVEPVRQDSTAALREGKSIAKSLAETIPIGDRLAFGRSFCATIIGAYWTGIQNSYREAWPVASPFQTIEPFALNQPANLLAKVLGMAATQLGPIQAGYLIGAIYTATIPDEMRARLGVFYTPPALTERLLTKAATAGVDWSVCRVLDPACGGGAFLSSVAEKMVSGSRLKDSRLLVQELGLRLRGFEIDPFAAWIAQVLLEATVMELCRRAGKRLPVVVEVCNTLEKVTAQGDLYDLVVGNPPYGRVTLEPELREKYRRSLYGHANLYGLFTDAAVKLCEPGGIIAFVTPASFLAGEYFKALRLLLIDEAPPVNIDFVVSRKGVFDDALQETLLATYRRGGSGEAATVHFLAPKDAGSMDAQAAGSFILPTPGGGPWIIPRKLEHADLVRALRGFRHTLKDYGYKVSTGPLVWNRHKDQLRARPSRGAYPLIWAESITADGQFVFRSTRRNHQPYFLPRRGDDWLISRRSCVLVQRTTAKEQNRRIVAAQMPQDFIDEYGAAVVENHLNMILPRNGQPSVRPSVLAAILNTAVIDDAFRCISGSVAVSAYELESLPLPPPEALALVEEAIARGADRACIERACGSLFVNGTIV